MHRALCWPAVVALMQPHLAFAQAGDPHLGRAGGLEVPVGRIILSLILCLAIALVAILALRRRGLPIAWSGLLTRAAHERAIQVVETRRLSPHGDACVLRHRGREYLVIVQNGHAMILSDHPVPPTADTL